MDEVSKETSTELFIDNSPETQEARLAESTPHTSDSADAHFQRTSEDLKNVDNLPESGFLKEGNGGDAEEDYDTDLEIECKFLSNYFEQSQNMQK